MATDEDAGMGVDEEHQSDSDDECASVSSIVDWAETSDGAGHSPAGEKKKKKKKKKKKHSSPDPPGVENRTASGSSGVTDKKEAETRYKSALDLLQSNDEDGMWIRLSDCHIFDAKARKISEALANNKQVTSLDLSANHISTEGAKALAHVLEGGAAPDLILLDLRGNAEIGEEGLQALAEVQKGRRDLKVEVGQLPGGSDGSSGTGAVDENLPPEQGGSSAHENGKQGAAPSPLVRKYFQVGDEDSSDPDGDNRSEESVDPETMSGRLWGAVDEALSSAPVDLPLVGELLREVGGSVCEEMNSCALPMLPGTCADELKTFTRDALAKLPVLARVLDLAPPHVLHTFQRTTPLPAVGSHRVAVADLVVQLLRAGCSLVSQHVAAQPLVPRITLLACQHPTSNALQCAVLQIMQSALEGDVPGLALGMFQAGWGLGGGGQQAPLQSVLARIGAEQVDVAVGLRPAHVGFVIYLSNMLKDVAAGRGAAGEDGGTQGDSHGGAASPHWLTQALAGEGEWCEFTRPGGPLSRLTEQQRGPLGPPKPDRNDPDDRDFLLGGFGRVLNGQSLLAMLQGLHGGGGGGQS